MNGSLRECSRARIPIRALPWLAPLRLRQDIRIQLTDSYVWVDWRAHEDEIVQHLLGILDVCFFNERAGLWSEHGSRLPARHMPKIDPKLLLNQVLLPETLPDGVVPVAQIERLPLRLVADDQIHPTTAVVCSLASLVAWAEVAPTFAIERFRGVWSGTRALIVGDNPPRFADDRRYWGRRLLIPLGYRVEPALKEELLVGEGGPLEGTLVLFDSDRVERIPDDSLRMLTRPGIRLAARGGGA